MLSDEFAEASHHRHMFKKHKTSSSYFFFLHDSMWLKVSNVMFSLSCIFCKSLTFTQPTVNARARVCVRVHVRAHRAKPLATQSARSLFTLAAGAASDSMQSAHIRREPLQSDAAPSAYSLHSFLLLVPPDNSLASLVKGNFFPLLHPWLIVPVSVSKVQLITTFTESLIFCKCIYHCFYK